MKKRKVVKPTRQQAEDAVKTLMAFVGRMLNDQECLKHQKESLKHTRTGLQVIMKIQRSIKKTSMNLRDMTK